MDKKITTIRIEREVKDRLAARGKKGETFQDIIVKLLEIAHDERL